MIVDQSAQTKATELLDRAGRSDIRLRLGVEGGGCAGLRYILRWSDESYEGDIIHDFGGFEAVVDRMSAPYLEGALLSYADTLESNGFQIDNPNAEGTCACGDSFH